MTNPTRMRTMIRVSAIMSLASDISLPRAPSSAAASLDSASGAPA